MKNRILFFLLVLLGAGGSLSAQTVVPITNGAVTIDASVSRSFKVVVSATITSVSIVNPSAGEQITVLFLENATGGFTVTFGGNVATCTVTTTANAPTQCGFVYDAGNNQWNLSGGGSGSGGISNVSSLPATCTPGGTNNLVFLTTNPIGPQRCIATNTFAPDFSQGIVDVPSWGAIPGNAVSDAAFTNTSKAVTLSANDPKPLVGWTAFGTNSCVDALTTTNILVEDTVLSVVGNVVTMTTNAATSTQTGCFIFGPLNDTAFAAIENGPLAVFGHCPMVQFGGPLYLVHNPHFNVYGCASQITGGGTDTGAHFLGIGRIATLIVPTPLANYNSAPIYSGTRTMFFGAAGVTYERLGVWGGEATITNPTNTTCMINAGQDDFPINILLSGLSPTSGNLIAFCTSGVGATPNTVIEEGMGAIGWQVGGLGNSCLQCFFGDNATVNVIANTNNVNAECWGCAYGPVGGASIGQVQISGANTTWEDYNPFFIPGAATNLYLCNSGALCTVHGGKQTTTATNDNIFAVSAGAGHFIVDHSAFTQNGTGVLWFLGSATAQADDMGGNAFILTAGTCATFTAGAVLRTLIPTSTYSNPCTQLAPTPTTSGNGTIAVTGNNNRNEVGMATLTAGTTSGATPTVTLTFQGVYQGLTGTSACNLVFLNGTVDGTAFTGTWNGRVTYAQTASTSALVTFTIDNNAVALTNGSTYGLKWSCPLR